MLQDTVSARDQTVGGHRAKEKKRHMKKKRQQNTKCQQIEEYHPVCLSHCGVMCGERKNGEELSRSSPADRRSSGE